MLFEANADCGITIAPLLLMKMNLVSARKVALLVAAVCTVMLASVSQARAERHPLPPQGTVPDAGSTVLLLGAALGALGMARRFMRKP